MKAPPGLPLSRRPPGCLEEGRCASDGRQCSGTATVWCGPRGGYHAAESILSLAAQEPNLEQLSRIQGLLGCSDMRALDFLSYLLALALVPKPRAPALAYISGQQQDSEPGSAAYSGDQLKALLPKGVANGDAPAANGSSMSPASNAAAEHGGAAHAGPASAAPEVQINGAAPTNSSSGGKRRRVLTGGKHAGHGKVDVWQRSLALLEQSLAAAAHRAAGKNDASNSFPDDK